MQIRDIPVIFRTKTFKIILALFFVWVIGFIVFLVLINPDETKTPGDPINILRDFIWIFYWRWNLDYIMIPLWGLIVVLESWLFRQLMRKIPKDTLSTWISPILTMGFAYLYMLAIDLAVTFFADVGFNGTWEDTEIIWFGFTAQQLYHNFFFWLIPIVIICGAVNQVMIHKNLYTKSLKTWFVFMAIYSLNLGLLDPVVCQILWDDWTLFGSWAMGDADSIWAEGWIAHYIIFAVLWIVGTRLIENLRRDIIRITNNKENQRD